MRDNQLQEIKSFFKREEAVSKRLVDIFGSNQFNIIISKYYKELDEDRKLAAKKYSVSDNVKDAIWDYMKGFYENELKAEFSVAIYEYLRTTNGTVEADSFIQFINNRLMYNDYALAIKIAEKLSVQILPKILQIYLNNIVLFGFIQIVLEIRCFQEFKELCKAIGLIDD